MKLTRYFLMHFLKVDRSGLIARPKWAKWKLFFGLQITLEKAFMTNNEDSVLGLKQEANKKGMALKDKINIPN